MKKTRFLAAALILVLLVSALPLSALATNQASIDQALYPYTSKDAVFGDIYLPISQGQVNIGDKKVTINGSDYDRFIDLDIFGHHTMFEFGGIGLGGDSALKVTDGRQSLEIPVRPDPIASPTEYNEWLAKYSSILIGYTLHGHAKNSPWYADNNNHWKVCTQCKRMFGLNWHHDVDNDGICDQCHQPIHYRYVTVKDVPGGKVEVSKEKCMLGNRVSVTVTPDKGYHLQEVHGVNNNPMQSPRPCFATRTPNQYFMIVDVWDIEVQPTFVKD